MPIPIYGMISVTDGERIYLLGGKTPYSSKHNRILVYHTQLNKWMDISGSFKHFRNGGIASVAYLEDYESLLITGNSMVNDSIKSVSVFYNLKTYRSSVALENPVNYFFQSLTYHQGLAYFWGGHKPFQNTRRYEGSSSSFYYLDPSKLSFGFLEKMPIQASSRGLVVGNKLYAIGGMSMMKKDQPYAYQAKWHKAIYSYDFVEESWDLFAQLPNALKNFTTASYQSYLFILHSSDGSVLITVVDSKTKDIRQLETNLDVQDYAASVVKEHLYIIGGRDIDGPTEKTYRVACSDLIANFHQREH